MVEPAAERQVDEAAARRRAARAGLPDVVGPRGVAARRGMEAHLEVEAPWETGVRGEVVTPPTQEVMTPPVRAQAGLADSAGQERRWAAAQVELERSGRPTAAQLRPKPRGATVEFRSAQRREDGISSCCSEASRSRSDAGRRERRGRPHRGKWMVEG